MSTGILDQVRAPQSRASRTAAPDETDRRRREPARERTQPEHGQPGRTARRGASPGEGAGKQGRGQQARGTQTRGTQTRGTRTRGSQVRGTQGRGGQARGGQGRSGLARAHGDLRAGGTAPFVLLIMVLLTSGLVATLWLSTAAAADSYRLESERQHARDLSEQTERLHRDVESARSAPAIAAAAQREGMVPAGEPAVLLVAPDGSSRVIGSPRAARAATVSAPKPAATAARPAAPRAVADPEVTAQTGADHAGADHAGTDETGTSQAGSPPTSPTGQSTQSTQSTAGTPGQGGDVQVAH